LTGYGKRIQLYSDYLKRKFGGRLQKISIDAGFTCPNRDGTRGTGGCSFCLNAAFNPSYCNPAGSVNQQIEDGIQFHEKRYRRAQGYLAYFQAFSNTYGPLDKLVSLYEEALANPAIKGIVIGTRPDCIDEEKLQYFQKLAARTYLVIEYGIESVYDNTLLRINRCHTFNDTSEAIIRTAEKGILTGGHVIFGLPRESRSDMMNSASILSKLPLHSIKFHQLQIFRGTAMADDFEEHPESFSLFSQDEYLEFMCEYIELLNPELIIDRIAGETPPRFAVIRPWGPRYDQVLTRFLKLLEQKNTWQGRRFNM
jgi:radical SAM protein (TIGR01212 family)